MCDRVPCQDRAKPNEAPKSTARMGRRHTTRKCRKERPGSAGRPDREIPQGAARLNSPQIPEPTPCRGPRPLPCRPTGAPLPASPQHPESPKILHPPAAPRHHPETKHKKAPNGAAWMCRERQQESAAEICREARQRNAARRSPVEFPEKTRTHPLPWAPPTPLTPQALPCPRARNTPHPQRHPESPPPRAITPSRSVGQRRRRGRDVP